jgi:alpha-beta hydrolase superfamily lysophospholipase
MSTSDLPPISRWEDVAERKGAVQIIHGLAEHPGRYERLARALNGAGLIVWAHHQRGHGSNPVPGIRGHFGDRDGWRALIDDAQAVAERLIGTWPGLPVVLFAHSMGSFVGQGVIAERGETYCAAIFSGTNGPPAINEQLVRNLARLQVVALGGRAPGTWLQKLVIQNTYNAAFGPDAPANTWLSRDSDEVKKYNADDRCGFPLTSQAWLDLLNARVAQSTVAFFRKFPSALPIRVIAGTCDPVGEQTKGVRRLLSAFADAKLSRLSSQFYDGARHELVNETNREKVTQDLIDWISSVTRA